MQNMMTQDFFSAVNTAPDDPILGLVSAFRADKRLNKVNLSVGAYQTSQGTPYVLDCVRRAESLLLAKNLDKEYPPIEGNREFARLMLELVLGDSTLYEEGHIAAAQTIGASGALRVIAEFLHQEVTQTVYVSKPTWGNHLGIFQKAGFQVLEYPYYSKTTGSVDFSALCAAVLAMPARSAILLHASCHNPTGCDITLEQWKELSGIIMERNLIPIFDCAYQGLGEGIEQDCQGIRHFVKEGHQFCLAVSTSKNFGLYGERAGLLAIITGEKSSTNPVMTQLKRLIRANYSMPAIHGARIVAEILANKELAGIWKSELANMRSRIVNMRSVLTARLEELTGRDFDFLRNQKGMFSFTNLNEAQVHRLIQQYAIYMTSNGRISVAGLNEHNLDYVVQAIQSVML